MKPLEQLWCLGDESAWVAALDRYWTGGLIGSDSMALEQEMDRLDIASLRTASPIEWYKFLLERYFRWKYTAPNRYATTTRLLRAYAIERRLAELDEIRQDLFTFDRSDVRKGLEIASRIRGLGVAGASGLLAIMFPTDFGTVDQFVVKALRTMPSLPQWNLINHMNGESLRIAEGVVLINIMREKARELNLSFSTDCWTPRRIDMVLWACRA